MNKDIQSLIEREAEEYADSKGIYNQPRIIQVSRSG